jgi:tetratricopeptide (TPR) repeat protein
MGPENREDPFSCFPDRYRLKARENEDGGDLPKALKAWEIVKSFIPADEEADKKIAQLKEEIPAAADLHFQKGVAFFQSHSYSLAQKEFLFALYLKPDHGEAAHYLKEKMAGEDIFTYEVRKGDTVKKVARKIYKDPQKDFLIAYFNGLKVDSRLEPPLILRMPIVNSPPPERKSTPAKKAADLNPEMAMEIKEILGKARGAYQVKNYLESAALTAKILEYDPANKECRGLRNASFYQLGKKFSQEKKYQQALEAFHHVDSGYKDVSTQLAQNRKHLAEVHYLKGVKFFIEEKIEGAIQEWQTALALEPKHPKAKKDIENARNLLKKLEKVR